MVMVQQVFRGFEGLLAVAVGAVLVISAGCAAYMYWAIRSGRSANSAWQRAARVVFGLVLVTVLAFLLQPSPDESTLNLVPGRNLFASADIHTSLANLFGNIVIFVPLGVLAPECSGRLGRPVSLLILGLGVSVPAEAAQYSLHLGRAADTTDVLLNVAGILAGGLLNSMAVRPLTARLAR